MNPGEASSLQTAGSAGIGRQSRRNSDIEIEMDIEKPSVTIIRDGIECLSEEG